MKNHLRAACQAYTSSVGFLHFVRKLMRFTRRTTFSAIEEWLSLIRRDQALVHTNSHFKECKQAGIRFGGWALTKTSLRAFILEMTAHRNLVLELGGGQSTLFWDRYNPDNTSTSVTTFEHDRLWYEDLRSKLKHNTVDLRHRNLRILSEDLMKKCFCFPQDSLSLIRQHGIVRDRDSCQISDVRDKIVFYDLSDQDLAELGKIHFLLLDGPHGHGRSMAFPILYEHLAVGAIILIDDYDHFPFLKDLSQLFGYDICAKSIPLAKSWIVVRIVSKKSAKQKDRRRAE